MSMCARCGLPNGNAGDEPRACLVHKDDSWEDVVACRDREIANLHSLLRSVTGKLERIGEQVNDVLEVLS